MISVVERLIESWLDSQTERRYQPAFIQLLVSEGWSVLHNTRHSQIELGKDVIARDPSGVLHCFQLKGNPGSRVTKSEAQSLLDQVRELVELPPPAAYRTSSDERHVAVFVTNGGIDEEAQLVFEGVGQRTQNPLCPASKLELVTRGQLLQRFVKAAGEIWPTSIEGTRQILNLMAQDGRSLPDPKQVGEIFEATAPRPEPMTSQPARNARLSALLLVSEIVKSPWYATANHYGLYMLTVLAAVHALRFADQPNRLEGVRAYADLALDHCRDLMAEVRTQDFQPDLIWGDVLSEFDYLWERSRLVADCASTLLVSGAALEQEDQATAANLVTKTYFAPMLWGLGAVPSYIVRYWAVCRVDARRRVDVQFEGALKAILLCASSKGGHRPLAGPYYGFEDVWALSAKLPFVGDDTIFDDSFDHRLWFARSMLYMLAKRNEKHACKRLWAEFSQSTHEEPSLPVERFYDARLVVDVGEIILKTYHRKDWAHLVSEAVDESQGSFLDGFDSLAWLIAAYMAIVPYRAWNGALMWVDHRLNKTWYGPGRTVSA
jgi:hypothetical protein